MTGRWNFKKKKYLKKQLKVLFLQRKVVYHA
jgi:hypothetical protein